MCLLTYLPEGVQPDVPSLRCGARFNDDGHGFAIVIPNLETGKGRILVRKSMNSESLIKEFVHLRATYPDGPALFHSRITTDGATNLYNCHPFMHEGDRRTVIGHNGILPRSVRPGNGDKRSDTRIFAEQVAGMFKLHTVLGRQLAGEWMGSYNKIVILSVDPIYDQYGYIVNEKEGEWHNGSWYSNSSFKGYRMTGGGGGYTYSSKNGIDWSKWEWCQNLDCTAKTETVSPGSLRCTRCGHCSLCIADPCECVLTEAAGGKGASPLLLGSGTVIGGKPKGGATVRSGIGWEAEYEASVEEYYEALDAARAASAGIKSGGYIYDVDPEDDPDSGFPSQSQLEQVLALVEYVNNGGDVPTEDGMGDGWPPDSDPEVPSSWERVKPAEMLRIDFLDEVASDLIKRGDRFDDQDALMLMATAASEGSTR